MYREGVGVVNLVRLGRGLLQLFHSACLLFMLPFHSATTRTQVVRHGRVDKDEEVCIA
jgi:hypothetical protein